MGAAETLEEIPGQVVSFYSGINKAPNAPMNITLNDNFSNMSLDEIIQSDINKNQLPNNNINNPPEPLIPNANPSNPYSNMLDNNYANLNSDYHQKQFARMKTEPFSNPKIPHYNMVPDIIYTQDNSQRNTQNQNFPDFSKMSDHDKKMFAAWY